MATRLYLTDTVADTHLGTDSAAGAVRSSWTSRALSTSRGSGVVASFATPTATFASDDTQPVMASSGTYLEWISPPVAADVTISGTVTFNLWASENNMSANMIGTFYVYVLRANATATRDSNTRVQVAAGGSATEIAVTTRSVLNSTIGGAGITVNRGDRIRVIVGGAGGSSAATFTWNIGYNGASAAADGDSYVSFTENFSFENAPGTTLTTGIGFGGVTGNVSSQTRRADSFTATGATLTEVRATISKTGSPTDDLIVEIWSDSAGAPNASIGAVATIAGTALTTTLTETTWSGLSITLTPGSTYWVVFRRSAANDASNYYNVDIGSSGTSLLWDTSGTPGWVSYGADLAIRVVAAPTPLYLTNTASAVSTASQDLEAWTSRGSGVVTSVTNTAAGWTAPLQATTTAGGTVIDWFTRPLAAFTLTGMAVANIRALESNASANASLRCEIARVSNTGTSPTVWCSWCCAPTGTDNGELTTSEVARTINLSGDDLAIADGERLRIRLYNDDISSAAMGASQTVTRYYSGTSGGASGDSYITLPQTVTEFGGGTTYTKAGYGRESA